MQILRRESVSVARSLALEPTPVKFAVMGLVNAPIKPAIQVLILVRACLALLSKPALFAPWLLVVLLDKASAGLQQVTLS